MDTSGGCGKVSHAQNRVNELKTRKHVPGEGEERCGKHARSKQSSQAGNKNSHKKSHGMLVTWRRRGLRVRERLTRATRNKSII